MYQVAAFSIYLNECDLEKETDYWLLLAAALAAFVLAFAAALARRLLRQLLKSCFWCKPFLRCVCNITDDLPFLPCR